MAEEKIENGQELEEEKPLSLFEKKMKDLLDELDERLEQPCLLNHLKGGKLKTHNCGNL